MLAAAQGTVADYLNGLYPELEGDGRILHPDSEGDIPALLRDVGEPVLILHAPQAATVAASVTFTCIVSVCALTQNRAAQEADTLLSDLRSVSPIIPTTRLQPHASTIREDAYWRVATAFTLKLTHL